jgi:hypothetical protein
MQKHAKSARGAPDVVLRALGRLLYLKESEEDGSMVRRAFHLLQTLDLA